MMNYPAARQTMVESQLRPNGVSSPAVLEAFSVVPRERFVPEDYQALAYVDNDLVFADGRFLMEAMLQARMMEAVSLTADDVVLNVGDVTGYSSALFSGIVSTVVTLEPEPGMLTQAQALWAERDFCNIATVQGAYEAGCPENEPYSLIFINGALSGIPGCFLGQLTIGGRLIVIERTPGAVMGAAVLYERLEDESFSSRKLFDATAPYLEGFVPQADFVF